MLFAKETYVRFRNDGIALCKVGGIIMLAGEEKDVPFGNISTMSVSNGYKNGLKLIGLVVDGELTRLCPGSPCPAGLVSKEVVEQKVIVDKDPVVEIPKEPVEARSEEITVEMPTRRGRKPRV
jgi:hypothetical protein